MDERSWVDAPSATGSERWPTVFTCALPPPPREQRSAPPPPGKATTELWSTTSVLQRIPPQRHRCHEGPLPGIRSHSRSVSMRLSRQHSIPLTCHKKGFSETIASPLSAVAATDCAGLPMRGSTSSPKALSFSPRVDPYSVGGGGETERSEERG